MYAGVLRHGFNRITRRRNESIGGLVPEAPYVVSRYDLGESAGFDMANFDESAVEQEDVGMMHSNLLHGAFPLNYLIGATELPMFVDVQAEL